MYVIIPTTQRSRTIERTLSSLAAVELPSCYRSTLVVENGPAGRISEIVRHSAAILRAEHLHVPTPGKSAALNAAVRHVAGSWVVFADDDIRFDPGVLMAYARALERHPSGHYFGGPFGVDYDIPPPSWIVPFLPTSAKGRMTESVRFLGFNWCALGSDIIQAGGFDESIGPGSPWGCSVGDEPTMQSQLRKLGRTPRYVPDALVHHYVPVDRCSAAWVLDRAYRGGLFKGFNGVGKNASLGRQLCQVSKSTISAMRDLLVSHFRADPETQFASKRNWKRACGVVVGVTTKLSSQRGTRSDG